MLDSAKSYLYRRRWGLAKTVGVVGGVFVLGRYAINRLEEIRDNVMQERLAREHLRRRFRQNQEDAAYTIMALLPTLSKHVLEEMDVESITRELQALSKSPRTLPHRQSLPRIPPQEPSESSLTSSVEVLQTHDDQEVTSDNGSMMFSSSISAPEETRLSGSSSWVEQLSSPAEQHSHSQSSSSSNQPPRAASPRVPGSSPPVLNLPDISRLATSPRVPGSSPPLLHIPDISRLSDSMGSMLSSENEEAGAGIRSPSSVAASDVPSEASSVTRTKGELWQEVKILTFTRTLTILYSVTLLSLFTSVQLSILGRSKYINSVQEQEREERKRDGSWDEESDEGASSEDTIDEEMEMLYLTLSWWILHVGWKDVGERVRREVEGVFVGVSLKARLGVMDLFRLFGDVRRRVEHEITFEGCERRINFLSALLPQTAETLQHLLTQGGITKPLSSASTRQFNDLLDTTRCHICSPNFVRVMEVAMDHSTEILFSGLRKDVFGGGNGLGSGSEERLRLAALLPGLARWGQSAMNGLPNELVDGLMGLRETEAQSAIIFTSYEDRFQ